MVMIVIMTTAIIVSDTAVFVLKRDVKLRPTNQPTTTIMMAIVVVIVVVAPCNAPLM